ncbi:MAG: substrate-binding domain-containing protein [Sneathiella sp.]|uniref:substrate-binding domain-containing protein n=1 Tax=Sneathiella sp. TaxID=1964365 RepID=UPI0030037B74
MSLLISFFYLSILNSSFAADMKLAVTTSFHNSGLSDVLLPEIKKDLELDVHLIVVGTGQALKLGRAGDVDAILVHSKKAEEEFIRQGYGSHRREIMFNDFILIGPVADPAQAAQHELAVSALRAIEKARKLFVSRGDDSGTNRKEIALWLAAGLDPAEFPASWYRAAGAGMGATLNTASAMNAYAFTDRASWLNFKNKGNLALVFEGDPILFNQYSYIPVDIDRHPHTKYELATKLEEWLASDKAQAMIAKYEIAGQQLFTPNATID